MKQTSLPNASKDIDAAVMFREALPHGEERQLRLYGFFWTGILLLASLAATLFYADFNTLVDGFLRILSFY